MDPFRAREMADAFRRYNATTVEAQLAVYKDETRYLAAAKAGREELEQQFRRDRDRFESEHDVSGWRREPGGSPADAD
jgi:hypothetical protein